MAKLEIKIDYEEHNGEMGFTLSDFKDNGLHCVDITDLFQSLLMHLDPKSCHSYEPIEITTDKKGNFIPYILVISDEAKKHMNFYMVSSLENVISLSNCYREAKQIILKFREETEFYDRPSQFT